MQTITISEYGLLGVDDNVENYNKFKSAKIDKDSFKLLEEFAKNEGSEIFSFRGKYLQAKSYVGLIELKNGTIIEILPKIYKDNNVKNEKQVFLNLLKILYDLPNYKFFESGKFDEEKMPLLEIFIKMFLEEVEFIIKKGIKSDYIEKIDNLNYLKGKLLINKQLASIYKNKFNCEFDEYHLNRSENRLLKTTLKYLLNKSTNFKNKNQIRLYLEHLYEVELSKNIESDFRNIKINRGTNHYKNALIWAKIFLKGNSFSSFSGSNVAFSLLYPMEQLFENYVGYILKKEHKNVKLQKSKLFIKDENNKKVLSPRPDFIINDNIIADAKWKIIDSQNDFSEKDFYQLFVYYHLFNVNELRLYYPKSEYLQKEKKFTYLDKINLNIIPIELPISLLHKKTSDEEDYKKV